MKQVINKPSLQSQIAALMAENDRLKREAANKGPSLGIKLSQKGAISVYGLGRFPVTLYWSQWERLMTMAENIKAFAQENKTLLAHKE